MKHAMLPLLTGLVLLCTASPVFAAFHYDIETQRIGNTDGFYFTINVTEGVGKVYLVDTINTLWSANQTEALRNVVTNFGYYNEAGEKVYGNWDSVITRYEKKMGEWNDLVTQNGYELGTFEAGDNVEVWVSRDILAADGTVENVVYGRSNGGAENHFVSNYGKRIDETGQTLGLIELQGLNSNKAVFFGFYGEETSGEAGGGAAGQPLPGGLATILTAGAFLAGICFVRRKKAAAV